MSWADRSRLRPAFYGFSLVNDYICIQGQKLNRSGPYFSSTDWITVSLSSESWRLTLSGEKEELNGAGEILGDDTEYALVAQAMVAAIVLSVGTVVGRGRKIMWISQ